MDNDRVTVALATMRGILEQIEKGDLEASEFMASAESARKDNKNYPTGRYRFTVEVIDPKKFAEHKKIGGEVTQ
jgi:hypothetical protein